MSNPVEGFVVAHLDDPDLVRVTLTAAPTDDRGAVRRATIRPVLMQGRRQLQIVTHETDRATTTNVADGGAPELRALFERPFRHVTVALTGETLEGRVSKKGKLLTSRSVRADASGPIDLSHDRTKHQPIPEGAPFLELLGISKDGTVKPTRRAKYRQINEFIRLFDDATPSLEGETVRVLDVGCGSAYLTFALTHHLVVTRGVSCEVVGVDRNDELIDRNGARARALGWDGLRFEHGDISTVDVEAAMRPDIVIALHACDTASDHALASIVRWGCSLGLVAPCCHHHLQAQLRRSDMAEAEGLLLRHGILRERLGDVLTDGLRSSILRLLGFEVDVVEFVSPEHTPKNLLIRAWNRSLPVRADQFAAYDELLARWSVEPILGELLAGELAAARASAS